jgi:hypothetical protein
MKRFLILIISIAYSFFCFSQSSTGKSKEYPVKSVAFSTDIVIPTSDFTNTGSGIAPTGNAKTGYNITGSVDLQWKYFGWRFEGGANFNPVNASNLIITEIYPDAEVKHWTVTNLLSGPFIRIKLKESDLQFGAMAGANWVCYPAITFNDGHKIQSVPTTNFASQFYVGWSYPLSDKLSVGINAKYEFSNAEAKYQEIQKFSQLGNAFNLEYYNPFKPRMLQERMTNNPYTDPGPIYTGWIGTGRSEGSVKQKISTIQIGFHVRFKLHATPSTAH